VVDFREDEVVYPKMIELSACLCAEIANSGLPEPCSCGPIVGSLVLDYCGSCTDGGCGGQAWVRLVTAFPSMSFPSPLSDSMNCFAPLVYQIEVGIVRCKPVGKASSARGYAPPTLDQSVGALRLQTAADFNYMIGQYTPVTPDGDCLGGAFLVTAQEGY
jgi:hypothetical protein